MLGEVECSNLTAFFQVSSIQLEWQIRLTRTQVIHSKPQRIVKRDHDNLVPFLHNQWVYAPHEYASQCAIEHKRTL